MKRFNTSARVSGVLTAALTLGVPAHALADTNAPQLETDAPSVQTVIEEWHWRTMSF